MLFDGIRIELGMDSDLGLEGWMEENDESVVLEGEELVMEEW